MDAGPPPRPIGRPRRRGDLDVTFLEGFPILGPAVLPACIVVAVLAVGVLWWRRGRLLRPAARVAVLASSLAAPLVCAALVDGAGRPFAEPVGWATWLWLTPILLAALLIVVRPRRARPRTGAVGGTGAPGASGAPGARTARARNSGVRRTLGAVGSIGALAVVVAAAALGINAWFAAYPTLGDLLGTTAPTVTLDALAGGPAGTGGSTAPADVTEALGAKLAAADPSSVGAATGTVATVRIPAPISGFAARPAVVYLPPAAIAEHPPELPVLVLLAGQPGAPDDWVRKGDLQGTMDAFAAAHGGRAPIVVVPDPLGSSTSNPLCSDTSHAKVATYLEQDVAAWIDANFGPATHPDQRAIGGLSNGGTCALQVGTRSPAAWPVVINLAGEMHPDLGGVDRTIALGFDGRPEAFAANDPLTLLQAAAARDGRYAHSHVYFGVGTQDADGGAAAEALAGAARSAGMDVVVERAPGGHQWQAWSALLPGAITWYGTLSGVTP